METLGNSATPLRENIKRAFCIIFLNKEPLTPQQKVTRAKWKEFWASMPENAKRKIAFSNLPDGGERRVED